MQIWDGAHIVELIFKKALESTNHLLAARDLIYEITKFFR